MHHSYLLCVSRQSRMGHFNISQLESQNVGMPLRWCLPDDSPPPDPGRRAFRPIKNRGQDGRRAGQGYGSTRT